MKPTDDFFTNIAREHLNFETLLKPRNSDSLDFHEVSACGVKTLPLPGPPYASGEA